MSEMIKLGYGQSARADRSQFARGCGMRVVSRVDVLLIADAGGVRDRSKAVLTLRALSCSLLFGRRAK